MFLILLGITARLFPHPANVAPIAAVAIFAGLYLPKRWALVIPLIALFVSDLVIGFYDLRIMLTVYGSFAITGYIGMRVREKKNVRRIIGGTLLGSVIFYLATNAAVWGFGTLYPHTLFGLIESYVMALPFFRNSIVGDLFFTGILVGSMELLLAYPMPSSKPIDSPESV